MTVVLPSGMLVSGERCEALDRGGLFLDRDGVLVEEVEYLRRAQDVRLTRGAADLVLWANRRAIPVVVVSNQSGIARGLLDVAAYETVEAQIARNLASAGARLDLVLACPFHPEYTQGYGSLHAKWRKPGPGMLLLAAEMLGLRLAESWMVGDKASDIEAARAAGLRGAVHVLTGHGVQEREAVEGLPTGSLDLLMCDDIVDAARNLKAQFDRLS